MERTIGTCLMIALGGMLAAPSSALAGFADEPSLVIELESDTFLPYCVEIGDLNNDGLPDLAVGAWHRAPDSGERDAEQSRVLVYHQREGGGFNPQPDRRIALNSGRSPRSLLIGDFNDDGKHDLAVATRRYHFHLFLGSEDLAVAHDDYNVNHGSGSRSGPVVGTMREGEIDFLVGPVLRRWQGGDEFAPGYFRGPEANDNTAVVLADLDNSTIDDAVFATRADELRIYYGPVTNLRIYPQDLRFVRLASPFAMSNVAVGDLNGDHRPDIVASGSDGDDHRVVIYYQNSPMGFTEGAAPSVSIEGIAGPLGLADVTGNGWSDLIVADNSGSRGSHKLYVFAQKPDEPFASRPEDAYQVLDVGEIYAFTVADVTGNGQPDVVTTTLNRSGRPGEVRFYFNRSTDR